MRYICRKPPSFSYGDINQGRYKRRCGISSDKREVIIMTNRDKINRMSNTELADILNETDKYNACKYCYHNHKDCVGKACVEGIERWLNTLCVNGPKNPPADKHVDLQRVSEKVCDNVNHPSHYTSGQIEVIDFIEDKDLGFHLGNAVKYISRAGRKNPDKTVEDLRKAVWYINRQIERLER